MNEIQSDVEQRLLRTARQSLNLDARPLHAELPLADLGDSLDFVDLIGDVEAEFGIDFSNEALGAMRTVGDLIRAVQAELRAAQPVAS